MIELSVRITLISLCAIPNSAIPIRWGEGGRRSGEGLSSFHPEIISENHSSLLFSRGSFGSRLISTFNLGAMIVAFLCCLMADRATAALSPPDVEFFESRIRPVLAQDCYECHRSGGKKKGGLALDSRQTLLDGGDSGKVIVPGDPAKSLLIQAIRHDNEDLKMPKARAKLEPSVIADFEKWIRLGAPDPRDVPATEAEIAADTDWNAVMQRRKSWWSFQPVKKPDLSKFPSAGVANHPVDRLIRAKLTEASLSPAPEADRPILIRRLSYALRGLPPSPEEIANFARDQSSDAYGRLVDSFLASPRFGERWARHWMDWIRYADSHGSEGDAMIPYAWRYRDYLIRALNTDVPYDQMVREHLAGDLLPNARINRELGLNESALGIGHLRMVFHGFAPTDPLEEQLRFTDDQISVVSKAFLGLTVSCARCHNHKFDPISQKDFYGWYGIFASCPPATIAVDAPDADQTKLREVLFRQKEGIKVALAETWLREADLVARKLIEPGDDLKKAVDGAGEATSVLHPFFLLRKKDAKADAFENAMTVWRKKIEETGSQQKRIYSKRWNLASAPDFATWRHDGSGAAEISRAGAFAIAAGGDAVLTGIYPAGVYSHLTSSKDRGVLLSPRVLLDEKLDLWLRITGDGGAVARYVVQSYPRDGSIYPVTKLTGGQWQWVKLGLDYWQGDRIHVEVTTAADQPVLADINATRSWFGISDVVFTKAGEPGPAEAWEFAQPLLSAFGQHTPSSPVELAAGYATAVRVSVRAWLGGTLTDGQALFLDQLVRSGLLPNRLSELTVMKSLVVSYREREAALRIPTRAPGVIETTPFDQPLLVRGDHKQPGEEVPRRFLDAVNASPYGKTESGRRELAEDILRPDNPLTSRVIVNRVWHHLFGRGLVATPDNFGRMGQEPSHPELLDFLATWFVEHGCSTKSLIRFLVTSETWRQSSDAPRGALEKDPNNVFLSHFGVRRLEAESIRDALLDVTGELKTDEMYGPPITGRTPRRSVYLRVKRNDLDPFLAAFDAPVPASTMGKRDVTNVPGQSLTLLNDPFVIELAQHWADRVEKDPTLTNSIVRIQAMFVRALGRSPTPTELDRSGRFLHWAAGARAGMKTDRAALEENLRRNTDRLAALSAVATQRVVSKRSPVEGTPQTVLPEPMAAWDFTDGLQDRIGHLPARAFGSARVEKGALVVDGKSSYVATAPLARTVRAKTLEAWVQLNNLEQQGGGVMAVQDLSGDVFDAIVIGEQQSGHWLAGSDNFKRTRPFDGPPEDEGREAPVHLAIVYSDDGMITGYRNGQPYGKSYQSGSLVTFEAGKSQVLFGNRHGTPGGNKNLDGKIFRARLHDRALTADEVAASAVGEKGFVSQKELLAAMTDSERREWENLQTERARSDERLKSLDKARGLSSEWADLGHALVNLKEFIFIR